MESLGITPGETASSEPINRGGKYQLSANSATPAREKVCEIAKGVLADPLSLLGKRKSPEGHTVLVSGVEEELQAELEAKKKRARKENTPVEIAADKVKKAAAQRLRRATKKAVSLLLRLGQEAKAAKAAATKDLPLTTARKEKTPAEIAERKAKYAAARRLRRQEPAKKAKKAAAQRLRRQDPTVKARIVAAKVKDAGPSS